MSLTTCILALAFSTCARPFQDAPTLEERLRREKPAALAAEARRVGRPERGAILFYQAHVTCSRCHVGENGARPLGPDLAETGRDATDEYLVESILAPSKEIKKGFATIKAATKKGTIVTGLLAEETADRLVLRDLAADGRLVALDKSEIEERSDTGPSSMPTGLVNGLRDRREFLDLVAYVRAVADGGAKRAEALKPAASLLTPPPLPAYEKNLDHAGMIADLGEAAYERGEAIYGRVCANCHGTPNQEGTMPTSLKFASGTFKRGSDPYAMYQTLTLGQGQMPAQTWMVPQQKYDVIHYIRERYLEPLNKKAYRPVDANYLAGLPKGTSRGPRASTVEAWSNMDYGPFLMGTIEVGDQGRNFAYKGVAVRLDPGPGGVAKGRAWALYDHDLMRLAAVWTGKGFIDWHGISFDGRHQIHPRVVGSLKLESPAGPGWADPATGSFDDPRAPARDGRRYGPMPKPWMKYKGLFRTDEDLVMFYSVGTVDVFDKVAIIVDGESPVFARTLEVGPSTRPLAALLSDDRTPCAVRGGRASLETANGRRILRIPAETKNRVIEILFGSDAKAVDEAARRPFEARRLSGRLRPTRLVESPVFETNVAAEPDDRPFPVDVLSHPRSTPWNSRMRFSGFDFTPDGKGLVVCDWDGDVWRVDGLDRSDGRLAWRRIASGLFQPLGVKIVRGEIYVGCRDQIVILEDLNGDGFTDFLRCFNDDHQVTDHFHEFAMDLQTDDAGNFYYAKGARHALKAVVPQHGTLLRVNKDGSRTEILATGFRAPNGVCLNPDGTFYVTDQEGHWIPKNRINLVKPGGFYGNLWGYTEIVDPSDAAMSPPVVWITNVFDRSPSQTVRVPEHGWKDLKGRLITLSYGYGKIFLLLEQSIEGARQGGLVPLPITQSPTGLIRGRFRPEDGALYACGMFAWAGDQQQAGGLYRVRRTDRPMNTAVSLKAEGTTIRATFSDKLDPASVEPSHVQVKSWMLRRSENYGSPHVDEKSLKIASAKLLDDRKTVELTIPELKPTMGMEIQWDFKAADGSPATGSIHNTIHTLQSKGAAK